LLETYDSGSFFGKAHPSACLPIKIHPQVSSIALHRILDGTDRFYSVDLVCDAELVPYYSRFGMRKASSALVRHPAALQG
jgi:hypothetical protein